jgi:hypothetical protein
MPVASLLKGGAFFALDLSQSQQNGGCVVLKVLSHCLRRLIFGRGISHA